MSQTNSIWHDVRYLSEVLCGTFAAHISDLEVNVTDLEHFLKTITNFLSAEAQDLTGSYLA